MYIPIIASYFGDYHILIFKFVLPTYLFAMFIWFVRLKLIYLIVFLTYILVTCFALIFIYQTQVIDLLHVASYLLMFIGVYGFAIFISKDMLKNFNVIFKTILFLFFLSIFTEYFFAFLGFENAAYWDFKIYDAKVYAHGNPASTLNTFGNIGSGKGVTPLYALLAICSITYLFNRGFSKYILLLIVVYLGLMTYSRAFLLGLIIYGLFEVLNATSRVKLAYILSMFLLFIYILFFNYDLINIFVRIDFGSEESLSGKSLVDSPRLHLLFMQMKAISDKFTFGHGWSGMNSYFLDMYNRETSGELGIISFFVEQGFIRSIYIYLLITASLYRTLKFINSNSNLLKQAYIANLMILTFSFFWGATLVTNSRTVLMWLFIFLVVIIHNNEEFLKRSHAH